MSKASEETNTVERVVMFVRGYLNPKYVVMRGIGIDGRFIAFLGANPKISTNDYGNKVISFSNRTNEYYADNIYKKIHTMKDLIFWRKLLGKDVKCIKKENGRHVRVRA